MVKWARWGEAVDRREKGCVGQRGGEVVVVVKRREGGEDAERMRRGWTEETARRGKTAAASSWLRGARTEPDPQMENGEEEKKKRS